HGEGGLDEIAPQGKTWVAELGPGGALRTYEISPTDFGLPEFPLSALKGGDARTNAAAVREVLAGTKGAAQAAVVMAAGATLVVAGKAADLREGAALAERALTDGRAQTILERLIDCSRA